jgi:hypothetical protein
VKDCPGCWTTAAAVAAEIGFDLAAAIKSEQFWIPESLYFVGEHEDRYNGNDSIFQES